LLGLAGLALPLGVLPLPDGTATAQRPAVAADIASEALRAHNRYRAEVGVRPLQWSAALAKSARTYGPRLAASGRLAHSPRAERPGESGNLWMGTRGAYSVTQMIDYWADERRVFRAGPFPNVSTTRNWLDVSHYTQIIWPETTHVGCHLERAPRHDFLICRYSPKGNRDGRRVGLAGK